MLIAFSKTYVNVKGRGVNAPSVITFDAVILSKETAVASLPDLPKKSQWNCETDA